MLERERERERERGLEVKIAKKIFWINLKEPVFFSNVSHSNLFEKSLKIVGIFVDVSCQIRKKFTT